MTNQMINLKEAASLTGKGLTTITRLARKYSNTKYVKKEGGQYLISKDWLTQFYPVVNQDNQTANQVNQDKETGILEAKNETISFLKSELEQKNRQINELTERIRESNIVIQSLQSRLQLPESHPESNEVTEPEQTYQEQKKDHKKAIIDLYRQGYSHKQIADYLNERGYLNTLGKPFTKNSITKIVSRLKQKGNLE